jgi:hypothetical protein
MCALVAHCFHDLIHSPHFCTFPPTGALGVLQRAAGMQGYFVVPSGEASRVYIMFGDEPCAVSHDDASNLERVDFAADDEDTYNCNECKNPCAESGTGGRYNCKACHHFDLCEACMEEAKKK